MQQPVRSKISQLQRQARQALSQRQYREAHEYCIRILSADQKHADALFLLGVIAGSHDQFGKALQLIDRALELSPDSSEYLARRAQCLAMLKRSNEALEAAEQTLALNPTDAQTLDTIGVVFSHTGEHERARDVLERAASAAPDNPQYQFNLASAALFVGDLKGAESAYEAAIAIDPNFCRAHWALADLIKATRKKNHVERLEQLLVQVSDSANSAVVNDRLYLSHALAKELEDLGEYTRSLEVLEAGKAEKRSTMNWSIAEDSALFAALETQFDASSDTFGLTGYESREPIFVLGLPRTGTTLVERILSSHSEVHSAGELQDFSVTLKRMTGTSSNRVLDVETIRAAMSVDFAELGRRYIESTRPTTGSTVRFIDKLPMNFLYIGFIARALPNAKIVCLRRNPMDSCLSNYRQLFRLDHPYYSYTYSLEDVADYYVLFNRLMHHWDALLPGRVLRVDYEQLVAEPEAETRRLLEHCDLGWEESCLAFHENTAPVATASAAQVREPINTRSVGRWKRYGSGLDVLKSRLEASGVTIE